MNGPFKYYPTFEHDSCQCDLMKGEMERLVDENIGEIVAQNPESPCMIKLINSQREIKDKPNVWSTMNTVKI